MSHLFEGCESLNEIDSSNILKINTQNVKNMSSLFKDCISLNK